ncbi:MAG TPA: class II aldolase/adducin family protein [Candidatus Binatia bacterium]|jgi:L-fuculose-phosphate aldolase
MKALEREIIRWGRLLFERRLISGWGGNISCRLGKNRLLITGQHAPLGFLAPENLVEIDLDGRPVKKKQQPSSETPMHLAVYRGTDAQAVIHAHPPTVLGFSLSHESFVPVSFEEKYTIGEVAIVRQETPTVTDPTELVEELRLTPVVIIGGHGTVAIGKDLQEAFLLTDLLEEAVQCQVLVDHRALPDEPAPLARAKPGKAAPKSGGHPLFSRAHMEALIASANADAQYKQAGAEGNLTTTLTLRLEKTPWTVHFDNGAITRLDDADDGEFAISGKREWWEAVFRGRLDPFLATQQGKLRLERGEMWKLSQWFKPFERAFAIWQTIPIQ